MPLAPRWRLLEGMLPAASEGLLDAYVSELLRWNSTIRLIGPKDEAGAAVQVVDSLLPYRETRLEFPLLDIGSHPLGAPQEHLGTRRLRLAMGPVSRDLLATARPETAVQDDGLDSLCTPLIALGT